MLLVTPCIIVIVQPSLEWIKKTVPEKLKRTFNLFICLGCFMFFLVDHLHYEVQHLYLMILSVAGFFSGTLQGQVEIIRLVSQMNFWTNLILFSKESKTKLKKLLTNLLYLEYSGLWINILCAGHKSLVQECFFKNSAADLLPALRFLDGLYNFCNFVIILSLM